MRAITHVVALEATIPATLVHDGVFANLGKSFDVFDMDLSY